MMIIKSGYFTFLSCLLYFFAVTEVAGAPFGTYYNVPFVKIGNSHSAGAEQGSNASIGTTTCRSYEEIQKKYPQYDRGVSEDGYHLYVDGDEYVWIGDCWLYIIRYKWTLRPGPQ